MARPKGSLNTKTIIAKEAFQKAFDLVGGVESLAEWAKENKTEFYKLYGRLIPIIQIENNNHRYVIHAPLPASTVEEWQQKHPQVTLQ